LGGWNDAFGALVKRSVEEQAPQEADYVEGGFLHCGKCRTRKQAVVDFNGEKVLVGIMCQCQREAYEAQKAEDRRRQRYFSVMQRLDWCDIGTQGRREQCHPRVLSYLNNWDKMLRTGTGLLLCGPVGTGKSTSAAYLVRALRRRYVPAIMTNLVQFGDVRDKLPNFSTVDLLVLDDLGTERQSDLMRERAFEIVDGRTRCGKPTVFTANLPLKELKRLRDDGKLYEQRLYSRVLERAIPVRFDGKDFRVAHGEQTAQAARDVIGSPSSTRGCQKEK